MLSQLVVAVPAQAVLQDFFNAQPAAGGSRPYAYLNYVLFDGETFQTVGNSSGSALVPALGAGDTKKMMEAVEDGYIDITRNGYLYVFVDNHSQGSVYFDDIHIEHLRGPLTEESHYYPFGLTMQGISSKAMGRPENRFKFNKGSELQNKEFSDGSGLDLYATDYRGFDPQIGRFLQTDPMSPLAFSYSPSAYASNNPLLFNDPFGLLSTKENPEVLPEVTVTPNNNRKQTFTWFGWTTSTNLNRNRSQNMYDQRRRSGMDPAQVGDKRWYREDLKQYDMEGMFQRGESARTFERRLPFGSAAVVNGVASYQPFADKDQFKYLGYNKSLEQATIDFGVSFAVGGIGAKLGEGLPTVSGAFQKNVVEVSTGTPTSFASEIANTLINQKMTTQK